MAVYRLVDGKKTPAGTLTLSGGRVVPSERNPTLDFLLDARVRDVTGSGRTVTAEGDPEAFLRSLRHNLRSAYLWAEGPDDGE